MSDFEVHPVGTGRRLKRAELDLQIARALANIAALATLLILSGHGAMPEQQEASQWL